jgi:iron complex transport system ATP-binding protein
LIEAEGLGFSAGGNRILYDIDLAIHAGEIVTIVGPNGSGKTTLLKLFGGLLAPREGQIELEGRDLRRLSHRERARRIAFVPQALMALPEVTSLDFVLGGRYGHLGLWRQIGARDRAVAEEALADADAAEFAGRLLSELSGGQRQRVLIARALAQEAGLLLVDEPTNSLDPEHQISVFDLLARLTCEGRGALVVTHDLNLASQFSTRLALMQDGRVVASGGAGEVLRREVLEPVYGPHLRYGSFPAPVGGEERPFVVPWLER